VRKIAALVFTLLVVSCQSPTSNKSDPPPKPKLDKVSVSVNTWNLDSSGNVHVYFTLKSLVSEDWLYVKVGFYIPFPDGFAIAYGSISNIKGKGEYTGEAYSEYIKGRAITEIVPYNYEYGQ
jgi:hypothetical protein